MKSEFLHVHGWEQWYETKKPSSTVRELLKKMNDVRVRATKTDPLKTKTTANVTIPPINSLQELRHFCEATLLV